MNLKKVTQKNADGSSISYEFDVPKMQGIPDHPGDPKGTDTVPAWLTPGEFVMNAEATRMFEPQIEAMNNAGRAVQRQQGGTIPEYKADGGEIEPPTLSIDQLLNKLNVQEAMPSPTQAPELGFYGQVPPAINPDYIEDNANVTRELLSEQYNDPSRQQPATPSRIPSAMDGVPDPNSLSPMNVPSSFEDNLGNPLEATKDALGYDFDSGINKLTGQLESAKGFLNPILDFMKAGNTPEINQRQRAADLDPGSIVPSGQEQVRADQVNQDYIEGEITKEERDAKLLNVADSELLNTSNKVTVTQNKLDDLKAQQQRAKEVGADTTSIDAEINKTEEELKDLGSPSGNKAQAVSNALAATEGERTPGDDNKTSEEVEGAGDDQKNEDPTMWEKAKGFIYDAFDEVLDTKGLTQAALLYLGSRALGYSHGGSLNYVGKAYAQQIGNKLKAADKASLSNKFTKESVEKYRKTGNVSDLKATSSWSDDKTNIYVNNAGKTFNVVSQKSADGKIRHIDVDTGKPIDIRKLELNEDRTARVANNSKRSAGIADAEYRARIPKDMQESMRARLPTPEAIGNATSTKFIEMGLNPAQANKIIADITREMINDVNADPNSDKVITEASLIPYVNKRIMTMSLEQQGLAKELAGVTPEALATTLDLNINQEDPVAVQKEIKDLATLWKSLNAKGKEYYNNRRTEGMPPILVLLDEVNKGKANKDLFKVK